MREIISPYTKTERHPPPNMANPPKLIKANPQNDSPLFRLAAETRNQIYELVYASATNEDGSIELNEATAPPSKALTLTCRQINYEAHEMYKAFYRNYPKHDFTLTVPNQIRRPYVPKISNDIFSRIDAIRVDWTIPSTFSIRTTLAQDGIDRDMAPLRFIAYFTRVDKPERWTVQVEMPDGHCTDSQQTDTHIVPYIEAKCWRGLGMTRPCTWASGEEMMSLTFSFSLYHILHAAR